jgi:hypothetical protein
MYGVLCGDASWTAYAVQLASDMRKELHNVLFVENNVDKF